MTLLNKTSVLEISTAFYVCFTITITSKGDVLFVNVFADDLFFCNSRESLI